MSDSIASNWFKAHRDILELAFRLGLVGVVTYYGVRWLVEALDPTQKQKKEAKKQAEDLMKKIGVDPSVKLSEYELSIASQLIVPSSLDVSWEDIGGLTEVLSRNSRNCHLSFKEQGTLQEFLPYWTTKRSPTSWATRLWKDNACQSHSSRCWMSIYQFASL